MIIGEYKDSFIVSERCNNDFEALRYVTGIVGIQGRSKHTAPPCGNIFFDIFF